MNLYEISEQFEELARLAETEDIPQQALEDTFEMIKGEFDSKIDSLASLVKNISAESEAIKAEENRLKERRQSKEKAVERIQNMISNNMLKSQILTVETPRNRVSFRKSRKVNVDMDAEKFYSMYPEYCSVTTEYKINKNDLKKAIDSGEHFAGANIVENMNLQIK
jgi:predicted  nucleic acid-binding Zn-ribbon protein